MRFSLFHLKDQIAEPLYETSFRSASSFHYPSRRRDGRLVRY
jgi:hypothetical protein